MVRKTRLQKKIALARMATDLGHSKSALARYETGQREWPPELFVRVLSYLGLGDDDQSHECWEWKRHRRYWDSYEVETDPGPTWADQPDGYPDFYRSIDPSVRPALSFRRRVRTDSLLEPCVYISWCLAGAKCAYVSLLAMSFPYHPLVTECGKPLSMARRAAFTIDDWILWPQVTLLVQGKKVRLDCLGYNGKRWAALEFDGPLHARNEEQKKWDEKRDRSLGFDVYRFNQAEILSGHIVDLIRQKLGGQKAS